MTGPTVEEYLGLHRLGSGHTPVRAPRSLTPLTLTLLEGALADPAVVVGEGGAPAGRPVDRFLDLVRLALWLRQAPDRLLPAHLASRAARFRFLVWTIPARLGWSDELDDLQVAFGDGYRVLDRAEVQAEARVARTDWLAFLASWEDDPWLAARQAEDPTLLERDLRWITSAWVGGDGRERPLALAPPEGSRADQVSIARLVVEQHWIARGALVAAARSFAPGRRAHLAVPFIGPAAAALPVLLLVSGQAALARWTSVVVLAVLVLSAGLVDPSRVALGLARVPAAVVVGQAVLISLTPRWWLAADGWLVGLGLLVLALGYLVYDSRAHGSPRRSAVLRGAGLLAVAVSYAACISIAALGFVMPAVADRGECLDGWWTLNAFIGRPVSDGCAGQLGLAPGAVVPASAAVLALMVGFSVTIGLAAQVLWDDRPISAPLGRVRRVRGGN